MSEVSSCEQAVDIRSLFDALLQLAHRDEDVRKQMLLLAASVQEQLDPDANAPTQSDRSEALEGTSSKSQRQAAEDRRGRSRSVEDLRADLSTVPAACSLKARALNWLVDQDSESSSSGELDPSSGALLQEAREIPGCKLWMIERSLEANSKGDLKDLAQCFLNAAESARQALAFEAENGLEAPPQRKLMMLMAEAQSALYAALRKFPNTSDPCQLALFSWLRERTDVHRIFISKFMDRKNLADPSQARDLAKRLADLG